MEFEQLGRKELQALAKQYKIKANLSNAALVEALKNAIVQDYENSMLEEDEEETHDMQIDQPQVVENVEISAEEQNIVEDVAPSVIAVESVPVPEPSPVIVEAEAPKITGKKRIIAPSVIAVEPVSVPEPEPSSVIVETEAPKITGKKRKAVTIALPSEVEEIAGPFSVEREAVETNSPLFSRKKEQDSKEAEPQKFILEKKSTINSADWKVGDKVQVCVDSVWITSVIKRVNKASFRVQMNSGEEATVKQTEILPVVTESQEKTTADDASESAEVLPPTEAIENCPQTTELQQDDIFEPNPNEDFMILNDSVVFEESDEESAPHANDESEQTIVEKPISITKSPAVSRHSIALMGTPSTTSKSKLIGCSAAKSVSRKSTSAISGSLTPSRRTSSTATLPWNSSTKPTFHVGSDDHNAGKTSGSERKKKPITPSRTQTSLAPVPQPAIVPKMNAAQRMRLEALQKKMEAEKSISLTLSSNAAFTLASGTGSATLHRSNSSSTQPPPLKKARTVPTPLSTGPTKTSTSTLPLTKSNDRTKTPSNHYLPHVATVKPKIQLSSVLEDEAKNIPTTTSAEAVSVKPKTTASTVSNSTASTAPSAARKTTTPNFDRLHQKSFERQKSLTSCVARVSISILFLNPYLKVD